MRTCLLDGGDKYREIRDAIDATPEATQRDRLNALFQRGAFHHGVDVVFARIMMDRASDDEIVDEIRVNYRGVACEAVFPQ